MTYSQSPRTERSRRSCWGDLGKIVCIGCGQERPLRSQRRRLCKSCLNREARRRLALASGRMPGKSGRPRKYEDAAAARDARNERRKGIPRDRSRELEAKRERAIRARGENGGLLESSIVRKAREIASAKKRPDRRAAVWDDRHDDLVGICILALCEGKDAQKAMTEFLKAEWLHSYYRVGLYVLED